MNRLLCATLAFGFALFTLTAEAQTLVPPPAPGPAQALRTPPVQTFSLPNGLEVFLMEKHEVPVVQANLLVRAGSVNDPSDAWGLATLTADLMDEGAGGRSALELSAAFERLGAYFSIGAGRHEIALRLYAPAYRLDEALTLVADVVTEPQFATDELERLRTQSLTELLQSFDNPGAIAGELVSESLYGRDHPYGHRAAGLESGLREISAGDVRGFYEKFIRPNNASLVVVGDVTADSLRSMLESTLGNWKPAVVEAAPMSGFQQVEGRRVLLVDKPGAAQSAVRLARLGVDRSTPDYFALEVLNTVLGGSFTSRLNQNLREDKGYTYGARSGFDYRPYPGPFVAGADVQTAITAPAVTEFLKELTGIRGAISEEEIDRARNLLIFGYAQDFQSVADVASHLEEVVRFGLPLDYFTKYASEIRSVTTADVMRVAQRYIDPENMNIFIVGDRSAIESSLRSLNVGEVEIRSIESVLGPKPAL